MFEGGAIAVLALGRKDNDEPFNSEDLALLTSVAGQVATAIENGRLYRQLHLKAEELGRMREFNENILESLDDGLVVFDVDERIVRWNRALEGFYGVPRVERDRPPAAPTCSTRRSSTRCAPRWRENPYGATLFRVPLTRRSRPATGRTPTPREAAGQRHRGSAAGQSGGHRRVVGMILLLEDITDRVRLEEQLQISEKMASIGLLAAGVAHEVNTPLTGISSFTQMLLDGADPADPKTVLLEKIEKQTFRAAKIVNGLLTCRGRASGDARAHIRRPQRRHRPTCSRCSSTSSRWAASRSGASCRRRRSSCSGIEHQLQQVFLNLFLNARDAMPSGGWLSVSTRIDGDMAVAEVADTGSGIPSEQLARIYDPFFTTKAIGRGTGLGLSIIYGIVREHEGSIRCDSAVGQGTRFTLTLPARADRRARSASELAWLLPTKARSSSSTTRRSCARFSRRC